MNEKIPLSKFLQFILPIIIFALLQFIPLPRSPFQSDGNPFLWELSQRNEPFSIGIGYPFSYVKLFLGTGCLNDPGVICRDKQKNENPYVKLYSFSRNYSKTSSIQSGEIYYLPQANLQYPEVWEGLLFYTLLIWFLLLYIKKVHIKNVLVNKKIKMLIRTISTIVILLIIIYLGVSVYVANRMTAGYPHPITTSPTTVSPTYESVSFSTTDGAILKGWFFKNTSDKAVIFVHGITQDRVNKDYDTIDIAKELYAQGYSILMYDSRGHGESPEKRAGFGITGGQDILGAVKFVENKGFKPHHIGIIADSNGAISLLMVSDQLKNIGALVSDSAAATYQPVMAHVLRDQNGIPSFIIPGAFLMSRLLFHVDFAHINPVKQIRLVPQRTFLFLHGDNDQTIAVSNAYALKAAASPTSQLVIFKNAGHVQTYKTDPDLYRKTVFSFLEQQLQ